MPKKIEKYYVTEEARERFRKYLFDERLSFSAFCKKAGACRQYLDRVIRGDLPVTPTIREHFKRGGYDYL